MASEGQQYHRKVLSFSNTRGDVAVLENIGDRLHRRVLGVASQSVPDSAPSLCVQSSGDLENGEQAASAISELVSTACGFGCTRA